MNYREQLIKWASKRFDIEIGPMDTMFFDHFPGNCWSELDFVVLRGLKGESRFPLVKASYLDIDELFQEIFEA